MTTLREAAQQALDDLKDLHTNHNITYAGTISRLEAALAEPVQEPSDPSKVICPACCHQFRAIPEDIQAQLAEQEPVAWRTFDGEGGWDYRDYELNEDYRDCYIARNGEKYSGWVEPLYTNPHQ